MAKCHKMSRNPFKCLIAAWHEQFLRYQIGQNAPFLFLFWPSIINMAISIWGVWPSKSVILLNWAPGDHPSIHPLLFVPSGGILEMTNWIIQIFGKNCLRAPPSMLRIPTNKKQRKKWRDSRRGGTSSSSHKEVEVVDWIKHFHEGMRKGLKGCRESRQKQKG